MKKILLCCSAGMSTSLLVTKMEAAAREQGIECQIAAYSEADVKNHEDEMDVLLLGPQVRFLFNKMREKYEPAGIPVDVINTVDYGTMNGAKVLAHALKLLEK
ncbi:PTS sugar transporter subunit IIB [Clostridium thermobutyricum]|uniref:PTS system, lactose/cellobiose family IIB component n=2 Tax=Clostridium thermobutyricum TaxID=29372 RepID=N9XZN0_9CLOT|nr:PTS sugar transporter subunit IIB [Clostridium thermobutyricum]ENZ01052.1 PTS system, lactose/cellobiose family IIB component [Clostridium thermobutyricum]OPX49007.1 lichenan-specific phosphotransferase enzyme IIB component [Clostridium thermobutyricum DSM 4928]